MVEQLLNEGDESLELLRVLFRTSDEISGLRGEKGHRHVLKLVLTPLTSNMCRQRE